MTNPMQDCHCGQPHTACTAHTRAGHPCRTPPVHGLTVCRMHGGSAPQARAAGVRRVQEAAAVAAVTRLNLNRDVDPGTALLEEVARAAGVVAWLVEKVGSLPDDDAVVRGTRFVRRKETSAGVETTTEVGAQVHVWWAMLERERDRLTRACAAALAAGVEERRVRVVERQAEVMGALVREALEVAGVRDEGRVRSALEAAARRWSLTTGA